jgi:Holliday junction DNA helicase RuvB
MYPAPVSFPDGNRIENEQGLEPTVRPVGFHEFVGQRRACAVLGTMVNAALARAEACDHVLFAGPPGLGKTTLAHILAREMGANLYTTSGPAVERAGDLAGLLSSLGHGDVLFIDEIHRLHPVVEENLYPAMEDFVFDIIIGQGPHAQTVKMPLENFTLVGATTRAGLLTSPLRDRFGARFHLEFYGVEDLTRIVMRTAGVFGMTLDDSGAVEIARRSRGTPRIANRLLRRVRDVATVRRASVVDAGLADDALRLLEIDEAGFDENDRRYLRTMIEKFDGGPVGLSTLAAALGEEKDSLEFVCEPYLLQEGYIHRTPRGRVAAVRAYEHLGIPIASPGQGSLV